VALVLQVQTFAESPSSGGDAVVLQLQTSVTGVLYSDYFTVFECWVVAPADGTGHGCSFSVHVGVVFHKSTSLRGRITSETLTGVHGCMQVWYPPAERHIKAYLSSDAARHNRTASPVRPRRVDGGGANGSGASGDEVPAGARSPVSGRVVARTCPACDVTCSKHRSCDNCLRAGDGASTYPCVSLGGCLDCGCEPVCSSCGCRCKLCGRFGAASACCTIGCSRCGCIPRCADCGCHCALCGNKGALSACRTFGCVACDCKPVCEWCGCSCGLCGNKGGLAACKTVGCAACACSPPWVPWGRKVDGPQRPAAARSDTDTHAHSGSGSGSGSGIGGGGYGDAGSGSGSGLSRTGK
jgi:hypothetical protein